MAFCDEVGAACAASITIIAIPRTTTHNLICDMTHPSLAGREGDAERILMGLPLRCPQPTLDIRTGLRR